MSKNWLGTAHGPALSSVAAKITVGLGDQAGRWSDELDGRRREATDTAAAHRIELGVSAQRRIGPGPSAAISSIAFREYRLRRSTSAHAYGIEYWKTSNRFAESVQPENCYTRQGFGPIILITPDAASTIIPMSPSTKAMRPAPSFQCRLCGQVVGTSPLSLGRIPVCNRFTRTGTADALVDLDIVECATCQLIQLRKTPPIDAIVPELPWIRYREPEGHLDALVEAVLGFRPGARTALGTGPFEQPLLSRLAARGIKTEARRLEAAPSEGRYPYLETWQATLDAPGLAGLAGQKRTFDVVSCRYIVEHCPDPVAALDALKQVLASDGVLVLEIPDSSKFLQARDYCFLWEEHTCYFVEDTLRRLAETGGYRVLAVLRYPGALEDALVALLEVADAPARPFPIQGPSSLFQAYRDGFAATRETLRAKLARAAGSERDRVALFGIGHQAIMFVNAFGIAADIAMAVDDDPDKAGFFPPGFRVPVVGSDQLLQAERIETCLFAVAPHIQAKVQAKLAPLSGRGVEFRSIFAALEDSIVKDLA
jgi:SAM-dependent methyltransferase